MPNRLPMRAIPGGIGHRAPESTRERVERHINYLFEDALTAGLRLLEFEKLINKLVVLAALEATAWNIKDAAKIMGMHRNGFSYRMQLHGIRHPAEIARRGSLKCKCGRWIARATWTVHMRAHIRRGEVRCVLLHRPLRLEYQWLRSDAKAVA